MRHLLPIILFSLFPPNCVRVWSPSVNPCRVYLIDFQINRPALIAVTRRCSNIRTPRLL